MSMRQIVARAAFSFRRATIELPFGLAEGDVFGCARGFDHPQVQSTSGDLSAAHDPQGGVLAH
ncbi:MAG: hypothetical protein ACJAYI_001088 [Myxococcota bacterium]|jgi:hypothetical protein